MFMASGGSDPDAEYALFKLLQIDLFKARITEARFKIIVKEEKEHIVEKKIDVILPLQGEFASPKAEGSLNADEYTGVQKVVDGDEAFGIGEDNDLGDTATDEGDDVVESGDISILNSHIGHGSPHSLQLWGKIGKGMFMCSSTMATRIILFDPTSSKNCVYLPTLRRNVDLCVLLMNGMLRRQQQQQIATNAKIQRRLWDPGIKIYF
nr:hypothetical protein [Tanacetum cinerariifolium]